MFALAVMLYLVPRLAARFRVGRTGGKVMGMISSRNFKAVLSATALVGSGVAMDVTADAVPG